MTTKLQMYFPMIRSRGEILGVIEHTPALLNIFRSWKPEQQEEFLDFCSGVRGVELLYDSFFKAIMDPERDPARLSELLSLLMNREVSVVAVMPHEGGRITPETLVVMDIIVRLEDGSLTTVEVQKYGYAFPGQRAACYSADMLLRQYKKLREGFSQEKKQMNYRAVKPVYTIVLYESSPLEFHKYPDTYLHHFRQTSDTGLELELLEEYFFIALDTMKEILQNKGIRNRLDAWLAFLALDEPEWIEAVIEAYPEFRQMYEEVYEMCRNIEGVMEMYSKELQELDRNTVQYMIDEMQETINRKNAVIEEQSEQLTELRRMLEEQNRQIQELRSRIQQGNR